MTGQLVHRTRAWENSCTYSSEMVTLAHIMRAGGYQTHLFGSMHFIGHDQLHGFHTHTAEHLPEVNRWEYQQLFQTDWSEFNAESQPQIGPRKKAPKAGPSKPYRPWLEAGEQHQFVPSDRVAHSQALRFLDKFDAQNDAPFFSVVSYRLPHFPYIAPKDLYDVYADIVDDPAVDDSVPLPEALAYFDHRRVKDKKRLRQQRAAYYALVTQFDQFLGDLMAGLERRGLRDNTLVIYVSDHGDMAGERGLFMKNVFYEWSVRVPMIFSLPGLLPCGATVNENVSLVDLLPTLQDIAGVDYNGPRDGQSLWPAATGKGQLDPERPVYCDYYGYGTPGPGRMTRSGDWKLSIYPGHGTPELYNLAEDPNETRNLYEDPSFADPRKRLIEQAVADWDADALRAEIMANQKQRRLMVEVNRCCRNTQQTHLPG